MKVKDNNWIDDVIKQHKKQLDDIKKSRINSEEIEESHAMSMLNSKEGKSNENPSPSIDVNDEDNLFKHNLESQDKNYMSITENYMIDSYKQQEPNEIPKFNLDYNNYKSQTTTNNEFDRYKTYQSTLKSIGTAEDESNVLKAKLETKKLRLRELKKQFEIICEENANLKLKLGQLENYKYNVGEKIQDFEKENKHNDIIYLEREREFVSTIQQLEQEKNRTEEKLNKVMSLDNIKTQEIELMHQKIRDFETILDENQNEHIESLKNLKLELESYKQKQFEYEKCFDILHYFFKKIQTYYGSVNASNVFDHNILQNKLIELENFINKIVTEKSEMNQKYSKMLNIQSKLTQSESLDTSQYHLDNVKKLNEKIYDLADENKQLLLQLEAIKSEVKSSKSHEESVNLNLKKTDKENIFRNNFIKEQTKIKTLNTYNDDSLSELEEEINKNEITSDIKDSSKLIFDSYKTLEQRVLDLEKELKLRERRRDTSVNYSEKDKQSILMANNKRSKSAVKKVLPAEIKEKVEIKSIKIKKKKTNIKSDDKKEMKEPKKEKSSGKNIKKMDYSNISHQTNSISKIKNAKSSHKI